MASIGVQDASARGLNRQEEAEPEQGSFFSEIKCCRVIDPRDSHYMEVWDMVVTAAIFVTAFLTPYEAAFIFGGAENFFFLARANNILDFIFIKDMCMQFFLIYQEELPDGSSRWVRRHSKIVWHYLSGWFFLDLISVLPLDVIMGVIGFDVSSQSARMALRQVRLIRLFRLAKIGRIVKRWQSALGISYGVIALFKFGLVTVFGCHWMSCIWGMMALQTNRDRTWLVALRESKEATENDFADPQNVYILALYWATMTLTSLGYGDVTAQNLPEYVFCIFVFALSGQIWAYVIGSVCGIISSLDPQTLRFQTNMDALNIMMADHRIPTEMRRRLRTYFYESKHVQRQRSQGAVVEALSPGLQGELTLTMTHEWLGKVWYLQGIETEALIQISRNLSVMVFSPGEQVAFGRTLFIVARGVVARGGAILGKNSVFGEDLILLNTFLRTTSTTRALTFLEVLFMTMKRLDEVREEYPKTDAQIRHAHCRFAVRRGFVLAAWREVAEGKTSFKKGPGPRTTNYFNKNIPSFAVNRSDLSEDGGRDPTRRASLYRPGAGMATLGTRTPSKGDGSDQQEVSKLLEELGNDLASGLDSINSRLRVVEAKLGG